MSTPLTYKEKLRFTKKHMRVLSEVLRGSGSESNFTRNVRGITENVPRYIPDGNGYRFSEATPNGSEQGIVPQGSVIETSLEYYEDRDWRKYFSDKLWGKGIEIGPLHRPMIKHEGMEVDYVDRMTVAELRQHYPELEELPLVEADIIGDAETMEGIADASYDFVIAAHVIEHTKNPIGAIEQWTRVLKPGGLLYLIVPDKRTIFDKHRVRTTLEHLILDYRSPSAERDFEHYLDYAIHVHCKIADAAIEEAKRLIETDYSIHFHVFLPQDIVRLLEWTSENAAPIELVEGPALAPNSDEFHLLVRRVD